MVASTRLTATHEHLRAQVAAARISHRARMRRDALRFLAFASRPPSYGCAPLYASLAMYIYQQIKNSSDLVTRSRGKQRR